MEHWNSTENYLQRLKHAIEFEFSRFYLSTLSLSIDHLSYISETIVPFLSIKKQKLTVHTIICHDALTNCLERNNEFPRIL